MYAQKIEGNSWRGEKLDKSKIDKMSGTEHIKSSQDALLCLIQHRSTTRATVRAYAVYKGKRIT